MTTTTAATSQPRTIADATGHPMTVPAAPQRVIALTEIDLDAALALGVKPAGMINGRRAELKIRRRVRSSPTTTAKSRARGAGLDPMRKRR
jgi:ABC-type Fe3+-hydroxamate transport system substrate-binding protein